MNKNKTETTWKEIQIVGWIMFFVWLGFGVLLMTTKLGEVPQLYFVPLHLFIGAVVTTIANKLGALK